MFYAMHIGEDVKHLKNARARPLCFVSRLSKMTINLSHMYNCTRLVSSEISPRPR